MSREKLICPKCGSDKIEPVLPHIESIYECKQCGYRGPMVIGDEELAAKIRSRRTEAFEGESI